MPQDIIEKHTSYELKKSRGVKKKSRSNVKYQVFISSTFRDLVEERQAVSRAVLELNHIPAGMELFPAFDKSQLDFIKRVIDDCDYYLIILGGKYGSLTEQGISFTEAEYDYAVEQGIPVVALINEDIDNLPSKNVEKDQELVTKLDKFREKLAQGRLVKFWKDINDLKSNAIISLTTSFDQDPQTGWRRGDSEPSEELLARYSGMRDLVEQYRTRLQKCRRKLENHEELDSSEVEIRFSTNNIASSIVISANDIIREFAAPLKNGFDKPEIQERLSALLEHKFEKNDVEISREAVDNVVLFFEVFEIAEADSQGTYRILDDKLHLLRAAFKTRKRSVDNNDEIPF